MNLERCLNFCRVVSICKDIINLMQTSMTKKKERSETYGTMSLTQVVIPAIHGELCMGREIGLLLQFKCIILF